MCLLQGIRGRVRGHCHHLFRVPTTPMAAIMISMTMSSCMMKAEYVASCEIGHNTSLKDIVFSWISVLSLGPLRLVNIKYGFLLDIHVWYCGSSSLHFLLY